MSLYHFDKKQLLWPETRPYFWLPEYFLIASVSVQSLLDQMLDAYALVTGRTFRLLRDARASRARAPLVHVADSISARREAAIPPIAASARTGQTRRQTSSVRVSSCGNRIREWI